MSDPATSDGATKVLVTGATSGIGLATVHKLRNLGHTVFALGRRRDRLEELALTTGAVPIVGDIRDTANVVEQIEPYAPDVVVNNAGLLASRAPFHEMEPAAIDAMIEINLTAPVRLSRAVLPRMVQRRRGHLIFLGSSAGMAPFPDMSVYGATKAGISMFCDNLRCDLLGSSVRVTEIIPGRVRTDLYHSVLGAERAQAEIYEGYRPLEPGQIADLIAHVIGLPESVDVSRIEVFPTDQASGGGTIVRHLI